MIQYIERKLVTYFLKLNERLGSIN